MAIIGIEMLVMLVVMIVELLFIINPVKMLGWLNLLIGIVGITVSCWIMIASFTSLYLWWFGFIPVFCGIATILRADGISKL